MTTSPIYLAPELAARLPQFDPAASIPPPPELPSGTLRPKACKPGRTPYGVFMLYAALVERLGLKPGQPINLLPPTPGSSFWQLDLRPDVAQRRLSWSADSTPRIELPLPAALLVQPLTLLLLPGEPYYPHVYPLLPAPLLPAHALAA